MKTIIWSKPGCSFCVAAKQLLDNRSVKYEERIIGEGWTKEQLLESVPNARTVPQIFLNGTYIGGFTELSKYIEETGFNGTGHTL